MAWSRTAPLHAWVAKARLWLPRARWRPPPEIRHRGTGNGMRAGVELPQLLLARARHQRRELAKRIGMAMDEEAGLELCPRAHHVRPGGRGHRSQTEAQRLAHA